MASVAIVGAGMAGLTAARILTTAGISVTVFDKGRGPGGRMATRRVGRAAFDHGAQFFTARDGRFQGAARQWLHEGVTELWCMGFDKRDGHPRFVGRGGMTSIPKFLSRGLDVRLNEQVKSVRDGKVNGEAFDYALLTAPVEQSLALMDGPVPEGLRDVAYDPCFALLATLKTPACLPDPGAVQIAGGEPISWIADNQRKGISQVPAVTIHAGADFTRRYYDADHADVAQKLIAACCQWFTPAAVEEWQLHRWRYARPSRLHPERFAVAGNTVFAGDAFGEARVEGAALSGMAAAEYILSQTPFTPREGQ
ncbi:MAG: FAD-dependent oxidoreductase [Bryobacteraceae bacterium]